jgi:hypothetical protein
MSNRSRNSKPWDTWICNEEFGLARFQIGLHGNVWPGAGSFLDEAQPGSWFDWSLYKSMIDVVSPLLFSKILAVLQHDLPGKYGTSIIPMPEKHRIDSINPGVQENDPMEEAHA